MSVASKRSRPLRNSTILPTTAQSTPRSTNDEYALDSLSIGHSNISDLSFPSIKSSSKSTKEILNCKKMFADAATADEENLGYINILVHPTPNEKQHKSYDGDSDGMITNRDGNKYLHHRPRRLTGGSAHREAANLILSPSQCKLQPAGLKFLDPKTQVNIVHLKLCDEQMKASTDCLMPPQRRSVAKHKTRATQTLFRESSAQTLPYLPGVSNDAEQLENLEIFKLPSILPGDGPPGLYEVEVLERARRRWNFANALKENFRKQLEAAKKQAKLQEDEHILEAFEWEHWIEREEYIQQCQMLRLELLIRMFDKREREMHTASKTRIEKSCEEIEARKRSSLKKNEIEYNRAIRRLEIKHAKHPRVWRKEHITQGLGDPSSEFYAPKMRYGVNPSRRHFVASHKGFDMRMDDLEKRAVKMDPKNLKCPFAKLREWSKPKVVLQEVEQNFCSDSNLDKLYDNLRALREMSRKHKYVPLCLKPKKAPSIAAAKVSANMFNKISQAPMPDDTTKKRSSSVDTTRDNLLQQADLSELSKELRQQEQPERLNSLQEMRCEETEYLLSSYEGNTIGWLMRFLSEEMCRLKEQRKLHFFVMMAKRKRWNREAAEAGLRQKENHMREFYGKLFKEVESVNKETTNRFLESILSTDVKDYAHQKAEQEVVGLARELDKEISGWIESFKEVQNPLNYCTLRHALRDIVIPDVETKLYNLERDNCIKYIIDDVLLRKVFHALEPYDVSFSIASDFVDRLLDNDLYLNSSDSNSDVDDLELPYYSEVHREVEAIIRKAIRYAVPGRRWLTEEERIAAENVRDILDDVFETVKRQRGIISVDMSHPPNVRSHGAYINLMVEGNDKVFKFNLKKPVTFESRARVKFSNLDNRQVIFDITKSLTRNEQFLLIDPDNLPKDEVILEIGEYVLPNILPLLSKVHIVPSTHDFSSVSDFVTTPVFAQSSSEEVKPDIASEEITSLFTRDSGGEDKNETEKSYVSEQLEENIENPEYITEEIEYSQEYTDSDGLAEAMISYDPQVKYSVAKLSFSTLQYRDSERPNK